MPQIIDLKKESDILLTLVYEIEKEVYTPWKTRLTEQLLRNVEVPGFRKGKAPEKLLMQNIDQAALQDTILRETIDKYGNEGAKAIQAEAEKEGRDVQNIELDADPEQTKEENGTFRFRLKASLFPLIDLNVLDTLKIPSLGEADLPSDRPKLAEFTAQEKSRFLASFNQFTPKTEPAKETDQVTVDFHGKIDGKTDERLHSHDVKILLGGGNFLADLEKGLVGTKDGEVKDIEVKFPKDYFEKTLAGKTAVFTVEIKSVEEPKFKNLSEVFQHSTEAQAQFKDEATFEDYISNFYKQDTDRILEDKTRTELSRLVVKTIADFALQEDKIELEVNRIMGVMRRQVESTQNTLFEVFQRSGIPGSDSTKVKDELQIKQLVETYVREEFKLAAVLNLIYRKQVEPKLTSEHIDMASQEVYKDPERFGLNKNASKTEIQDYTADRLQRQLALGKLMENLSNSTSNSDGGTIDLVAEPKKVEKKVSAKSKKGE